MGNGHQSVSHYEHEWPHGQESSYAVIVLVKVLGDHGFVSREGLFEIGECVAGNAERRRFDVMREFVKPVFREFLSKVAKVN